MAAGSITTLPALPEDGGSGAFPPGHFKDPKRLYCKNGGFFLRIHPDGRVDGVREKSDPHTMKEQFMTHRYYHTLGAFKDEFDAK
ncbi:Fibroblast growth factor 2 [Camelus dromedarius]|uniref:Fibroblast growth factor 2 n=1 Tax=Camelus dromedarius TaxID=9838 RepID=A0A5N4EGQ5_CAMDR|nr:Fibroblast growth factor 2 [Camelus dromedarius]